MKKPKRFVKVIVAVIMLANVLLLSGCGKTEGDVSQTDREESNVIPKGQYVVLEGEQETSQAQNNTDIEQPQETQEQETGSIMREYSDKEKERMAQLQEEYQNETAKPEEMIQEVDSAAAVTEGTLCYILSTGEYYLPDRELTDEELLEIIDCNFRIAINANRKTEAEYEAEDRAKRAELEAKVRAADGISEEEAIEIGKKALETDLGVKGKGMELRLWEERYGWKTDLCIADWSEIKEKDRGAIGYYMQFDFGNDSDDWTSYHCTVDAVDGSILEAYRMETVLDDDGISCNTFRYEH